MKFKNKYRLMLYKSYIDTGINLTSYIKYLFLILGLYSLVQKIDLRFLGIIIIFWFISCFFIGWLYYKYGWQLAQTEVSNRYNRFVKEMRKKYSKKKHLNS